MKNVLKWVMAEIVRVCDVSVCDRCSDSVDKANLKLAQQATSYLECLNYSQDILLDIIHKLSLKCVF